MLHYSDINYVHTTCVYCLEKRDSKIYNIHCLENVIKKITTYSTVYIVRKLD